MDIRFLAALNAGQGTQIEAGHRLYGKIIEVLDNATVAKEPVTYETAIALLYAMYVTYAEEAGYDPIGVAETLMAVSPGQKR